MKDEKELDVRSILLLSVCLPTVCVVFQYGTYGWSFHMSYHSGYEQQVDTVLAARVLQ